MEHPTPMVSTTNALGNTVSYEYDALGQATKVTDASGAVVKYQYDAHGNIVKVTNPLGGETKYTYDLADNLIKVTDPMERETAYTYDSMGNLTTQKDADGKETIYTYDLEGNLTSLTDENGSTEKMTYDVAGNLTSIVRPDSTTVTYDYDKLNNLVSKTYSEDDTEVLYLYDTVGNRTSMTDTTGESTYTYDLMGRVTSVTSADGKTIEYTYDNAGNLSAITYADGRVVSYTYDLNDRLTKVTDDGEETTYDYDAIGRVTLTTRPDGTKTTYQYDKRSNLTELRNISSDDTLLSSFAYTYNEQGYIVKEVAESEESTVTRKYDYNLSGELIAFTETEGLKQAEYRYEYDDSGNRIRLEKKGIATPETITYKYNKANQLVSSTSTINGKTEYEYDENGSLISEQTDGEAEITYEYTVEQRLSAVREGGTLLMAASYDGDGNRIFQVSRKEAEQYVVKADLSDSADAKDSHESAKDNIQSPLEDASGLDDTTQAEQASIKTYYEKVYADPADTIFWYGFGQGMMQFVGNINSALSAYLSDWFCHAWDYITGQYELVLHSESEYVNGYSEQDIEALRRAGLSEEDIAEIVGIGVEKDNASAVQYTSSGDLSQPTSSEQPISGDSVVIPDNPDEKTRVDYELTYYVNDVNTENTQVLMEYGKRDELKSVYTYGNERISAETIADTYNAVADDFETDYYLYDGRGSVAQVVSGDEIVESYTYDPFGNVTSGAPDFDSFYGYNGEDTNPVTGLQYLRFRYYDTEDGRFNVLDTYLGDVSEPLTLNRYSYTVNNPVMKTDPSGHWPNWLDNAVSTVKKGVSKVANWANENIVKPVVNTAKSAASWVNDNIIQPVKEKVTSTANNAKDKLQKTAQKVQQTYEDINQKATKAYRETKEYIEQRTAEIKQKVMEFSCGTAERLNNAWEATVDKVSNAASSVSEWFNNIEWDRVAQGAIKIAGGVIIVTIGAAAIAATGGLAAGAIAGLAAGAVTSANLVVAGTAAAGVVAFGFGAADTIEGLNETSLGLSGDSETVALNPVRDTLFQNNPDNYYLLETITTFGAAQGTQLINQHNAYYTSSVGEQSQGNPTSTVGSGIQNNQNKGKSPVQAYEVTTYEDFKKRSIVGDGLEGHELWQHSNLKENGYATTRFSTDASKQNVVIALPRDVHAEVNKTQYTLNVKMQTPVDNIISNADILYNHNSVPNSNVYKALQDALKHYSNVKR